MLFLSFLMHSVAYGCVCVRMPQVTELLCRRRLRSRATISARGWSGSTHAGLCKHVKLMYVRPWRARQGQGSLGAGPDGIKGS
jgi:hypothetical protein